MFSNKDKSRFSRTRVDIDLKEKQNKKKTAYISFIQVYYWHQVKHITCIYTCNKGDNNIKLSEFLF